MKEEIKIFIMATVFVVVGMALTLFVSSFHESMDKTYDFGEMGEIYTEDEYLGRPIYSYDDVMSESLKENDVAQRDINSCLKTMVKCKKYGIPANGIFNIDTDECTNHIYDCMTQEQVTNNIEVK